jgi:hypothetical protein
MPRGRVGARIRLRGVYLIVSDEYPRDTGPGGQGFAGDREHRQPPRQGALPVRVMCPKSLPP